MKPCLSKMMFSALRLNYGRVTPCRQCCDDEAPRWPEGFALHRTWLCIDYEVLILVDFVPVGQNGEKLPSRTILHNEVEFSFILEAHFEFDEERMVNFGQDILLHHNLFLLMSFKDVLFFEDFDGVKGVVGEVSGEDHFSVGSPADH